MRVGFATLGEDKINVHFGVSPGFAIYDVTSDYYEFKGLIGLPGEFAEVDKVEGRAEILKECAVVYCTEIGGPAAARLVQQGIHPIKVSEGTPIQDELIRFQTLLNGNPPPWLRKRLSQESKQ